MADNIQIDYDALRAVIAQESRGPVEDLAEQIAARVDVGNVTDAPVRTMLSANRNGWPVALVTIMHPAGLAIQAKHGALTKAAASLGLTVKGET